jgi:hypothetical protein
MATDLDEARRVAAAAGLTGLNDQHLVQLGKSIASARELAAKLPKDLHWSEEGALIFRLTPRSDKP